MIIASFLLPRFSNSADKSDFWRIRLRRSLHCTPDGKKNPIKFHTTSNNIVTCTNVNDASLCKTDISHDKNVVNTPSNKKIPKRCHPNETRFKSANHPQDSNHRDSFPFPREMNETCSML